MICRIGLAAAMVLALAGASSAAADGPAAATATLPPLERFAHLPFIVSPKLSPSGKRVAATIAINGHQRFAIFDIDDTSKIAYVDPGKNDINGWSWVNDDWLVARFGSTAPVEGDDWYLRRVAAISADAKKLTVLGAANAAQNADDILWIAHDGSPHVRIAMQTSVYAGDSGLWPEVRDFDVSTGKSTIVVSSTDNVGEWYADGAGVVRLGISYDDVARSYRMLYRIGAHDTFRTVSRAKGPGTSLGHVPAVFLADAGKAVAYDDDSGYDALYTLDLATLATGEKLFAAPGYDVDTIITDANGTKMLGARFDGKRTETHWFDPDLAKIQASLDRHAGSKEAQVVSWSRDFSTLIVFIGSADHPGSYYTFRPATHELSPLAEVDENYGAIGFGSVTTIAYKARDGLEISAVLTVPAGKPVKNLPLIVMPHGGPFARDDESFDWWAQFLASRGYAVMQPNYRGSSGFGTAFANKGRGQWGLAMQDDLTDAVKWAAQNGIVDPKRVCIVGGSYGGYAALRAAQRDTGVYRCAVSYAGVSDMPAMLRYDGSFLNGGRSKDWLRAQAPDLKAVSPVNFASDFSIPVLIMHGKADTTVPVSQSRAMVARLKAAGKTYRYVEQATADHHFRQEADRVQFLQELEKFLAQYNPA